MSRLAIFLLGPFHVTLDGRAVTDFEYDTVRALLAFLALESDRPHRREALAGLLWPQVSDRVARNNFRNALFTLRRAIGDATAQIPFLDITRDTVQFNPQSDHTLDVRAFNTHLDACAAHRHRNSKICPQCTHARAQAIALYRGNFLEQFSLASAELEEWILRQREHLRLRALDALFQLSDFYARREEHAAAAQFARRQLELDAWREEAHRQLMRAYARAGQRSDALAQYEVCRKVLRDELALEPAAETIQLYEAIRDQTLPALSIFPTLPLASTPFIGRHTELAKLADLINNPDCRLLTITGAGGMGKTRLAWQVASECARIFESGARVVSLAEVDTPTQVPAVIARTLEIQLSGAPDPQSQLLKHLRERDLLLVLDNVEHLLDGASSLAEILKHAPRVVLLVTSRERLGLQGEWVFALEGFEPSDARALFAQRAQMARADFALTEQNRASVARVCDLVEGMPLAIELAAASVRAYAPTELARRIAADIEHLAAPFRDLPARHQSIRAVFEHSWRLLAPAEQNALAGVAIFRGGFRATAAARVADAPAELLSALVDKSLVQLKRDGRYALHELVRRFAEEKLIEQNRLDAQRQSHLDYFIAFAEQREPLLTGPKQAEHFAELDADKDNLHAALEFALGGAAAETGLRLCAALWRFWWVRGYPIEGLEWMRRALAANPAQVTRPRANALGGAGILAWSVTHYDESQRWHAECLALRRELNDQAGVASALINLGLLALGRGDLDRAEAFYSEGLAIQQQVGNQSGAATALRNLALVAHAKQDYARARELSEASLAVERDLGNLHGIATALNNLGTLAYEEGDLTRAQVWHTESLELRRKLGHKLGIATSLTMLGRIALAQANCARAAEWIEQALMMRRDAGLTRGEVLYWLGRVALAQGDLARAASLFREGLNREFGNVEGLVLTQCVEGCARVAAARKRWVPAAKLFGAAEASRQTGYHIPPVEIAEYQRVVAAVRAQFDATEFQSAWNEGRGLTHTQAEQLALETLRE
jgi:predicted ATPase/DNA-binding SARP family transcriptional activator